MRLRALLFTFVETKLFTRLVTQYLLDEEYFRLQNHLIASPMAGDVIPQSGGIRKLRWRAPGRGKRSGYRVIYFPRLSHDQIWFLTIYPKNVVDDIPAHVLRKIHKEIENS